MSKLLIFVGENQKFDVDVAINAITSMSSVSNARRGDFIGAIFECEYSREGASTIIRIGPEAETITAEGLGDESLSFALELQEILLVDLHAIDMDYSFNLALRDFKSSDELKRAIASVGQQ